MTTPLPPTTLEWWQYHDFFTLKNSGTKSTHIIWNPFKGFHTWRFLKFDALFVAELRPVVYQRETVVGVTVGAQCWLRDAAPLNLHRGCVLAHIALEERLPHFGDQRWQTDNHTTDGDQLVYVWKKRTTRLLTLSPPITTKVLYANILDPDEKPIYFAPHPDQSRLTLGQHFTNFEQHWNTLKIEEDENYSRQQFIWQAKG